MQRSAGDLLQAYWRAAADQDHVRLMSLFHDDVSVAFHVPQDVLFFGGGHVNGKRSFADRSWQILTHFEYLVHEPRLMSATAVRACGMVHFRCRHNATGEELESDMRQVVMARDGLIVKLDINYDQEKLAAFMRLVSARTARRAA